MGIILFSLLPFYVLSRYLQKKLRPRDSLGRFGTWMGLMLALVFAYTFLLVFVVRLIFPGA